MTGKRRPARSRNGSGRFRAKRRDTHAGTIERAYRRDFGKRAEVHLGPQLKQTKTSLNDLVRG